MKAYDKEAQEYIESLETDNESLRVELELMIKDRDAWKKHCLIMQADRDCDVAA